jgi:hypothetical protein
MSELATTKLFGLAASATFFVMLMLNAMSP